MKRGSAIIPKVGSAYVGVLTVSGFPYIVSITREGDSVRIVVEDAPADPANEAKAEAEFQAYIDRATNLVAGG